MERPKMSQENQIKTKSSNQQHLYMMKQGGFGEMMRVENQSDREKLFGTNEQKQTGTVDDQQQHRYLMKQGGFGEMIQMNKYSFNHLDLIIRPPLEPNVERVSYLPTDILPPISGFNGLDFTYTTMLSSLWSNFKTSDKVLYNFLDELIKAAMDKIINPKQMVAFMKKIQGASYEKIKLEMHLNDLQVTKIMEKTALGIKWSESENTGRYSTLSHLDKKIFIQYVEDAVSEVNCIATCTARHLVIQLNKNRLKRAKYLLTNAGCDRLVKRIKRNMCPDNSWLKKFCSSNGISVVKPQDLEKARRSNCDSRVIRNFFSLFSSLLDRDPRLIFNMDETMMSSRRKYKVLVTAGKLPLVTSQTKFPHITACLCFNAAGYKIKPLIIIPNKATIKGLEKHEENYHIASTVSGWMNRDVFFIWCLLFVCEITLYRLTLPEKIRYETILLIVDGHKSRGNYYASKLLSMFRIYLLILPGHTSHVLQPFDVGIGSPLKAAFVKFILNSKLQIDEEILISSITNMKLADIREIMLDCFMHAFDEVATHKNIRSCFRKAGITPVNPEEPLSSNFIFSNKDIYRNIQETFLNNKCININDDALKSLFEYDFKRIGSEDELDLSILKIKNMVQKMHTESLDKGRLLTKVPDLFDDQGEFIQRIHLEA